MTTSILARLDAGDRALFTRWRLRAPGPTARRAWTGVTHLGGASCTIGAAFGPLLAHGPLRLAAGHAALALIVSHATVQLVKRRVVRPRPARSLGPCAHVAEPDHYSFPSGHSCAALTVALAYALAFPLIGLVLLPLALAVGASRVALGVHYPGDVLVGQLIAVGSTLIVAAT